MTENNSRMNGLRISNLSMNSHKGVPSRNTKMQNSNVNFKQDISVNDSSSMLVIGN